MLPPEQRAMLIQEETALPRDPLATLESDYEHAVLHLAWDLHKHTKQRNLLFAFVELLPSEVPPPVDDGDLTPGETTGEWPRKSDHRVFVRHAVMPAQQALAWYLGCMGRKAVVPEEDGRVPDVRDEKAKRLTLMELGEEPSWPNLSCVEQAEDIAPFCPQWHRCPRVHHLVPLGDFDLHGLWSRTDERRAAVSFLMDHFHFDLNDFPEYWGSVHLVAPNPVFRRFLTSHQPGQGERGDRMLVRFYPRAGGKIDGLELSVYEERFHSEISLARVRLHAPLARIDFGHRCNSHRNEVYDSRRGFLEKSLQGTIGGFQFSISLSQDVIRQVEVPAARGRPAEWYEVKSSRGESMHVRGGDKGIASAGAQMDRGRKRRAERQIEMTLKQRWFEGKADAAASVLRSLLHDARREVMIVDPYFDALDLHRFAPAVASASVPVRVLVSSKLKYKDDDTPERKKWEILEKRLKQFREIPDMNPISVRVMGGAKEPDIHDRFLVVDDRVWMLGSSLNQFGSRGTILVELPKPRPVRDRLHEAWSRAEEFSSWAEDRRKTTEGEAGAL